MLPESIEIGPISYKIEHNRDAVTRWRAAEGDPYLAGTIRYRESIIAIDPDLPLGQKRLALLHEVVHGVLQMLGINAVNNEDVVTPVASLLLDTLRRNPALVAFLTEEA